MSEKNTVFLTGADGLLGNNVARELLRRGYRVVAFVEPTRSGETLQNLEGLEIRRGNLLDPASVFEAMAGCGMVIHAAASTVVVPSKSPLIWKVNLDGTRHVVEAALRHGVRRFVNVASANMFGIGTMEQPGDETTPNNLAWLDLDYQNSKLAAHQLVMKAVVERGLPAVSVCPTFMLGPFDTKPSSGALLVALYRGKIPSFSGGGRNYIHVRDAAVGTVNALERGRVGEAYILGNRNMDYRTAFNLMAGVMGVKPPRLRLPDFAIKIFGRLSDLLAWLRGKPPLVSYKMTVISCLGYYYSAAKAIRELDLPQTPIEEAVRESFGWMKENGKV